MRLENAATIPRSEMVLGRANCPAAAAVGQAVYITAPKVGSFYQTDVADPTSPAAMPAVGLIIEKTTATECVVQFHGPLKSTFVGLTPGTEYYVGTDGFLSQPGAPNYPTAGGSTKFQQLGIATDDNEFLLHTQPASFGTPAGGARYYNQPLTGTQDGANLVFTVSLPFVASGPRQQVLTVNGVRQEPGVGCDYVVSESILGGGYDTITLAYPPTVDDVLRLDFDLDL